jgi:hypothetical protein
VERAIQQNSALLFGVHKPLRDSALGPFTGADSTQAVELAKGLKISLVSSAVGANADMIALWPDDQRPTHLFVCIEGGAGGNIVQRVDLSQPANANALTILTGINACDPVKRTPWGSIVAAEEAGSLGGLYEIMNPAGPFPVPVNITNRDAGVTSDPARVVKRKAVGSLSWEGIVILPDGTMYHGDELRPGTNPAGSGSLGGGIYKFVPTTPSNGMIITNPALSPFAAGSLYGLRVGNAGDYGQGTEIGQGVWVPIDGTQFDDANGNIILRNAQIAAHLTGYYRPEDFDLDPIAFGEGRIRFCVANTGRVTNGGGSAVETAATWGEVICVSDNEDAAAATGRIPTVRRFVSGYSHASMFDNLGFQPHTGNLVILEDSETTVVKSDETTEERGNDVWMCLPDGGDRDVQTDGCIRIMSLKDTASEPTGWIFTASGRTAYVSLQHRATGVGALMKVTGFDLHRRHSGHDDDECDEDDR